MEEFNLYDLQGNLLDKTMIRGQSNQVGEYHLVVHIWIRNRQGNYLIQQRNKLTDTVPYRWSCTAGAVTSGETSLEGAVREVVEEIGLKLNQNELQLLKRYFIDRRPSNFIVDLYLVEKDVDIETIKIDNVEVKAVDFKSLDQIKTMINEGRFWDMSEIPQSQEYLEYLEKS